mmetsp:Transcript_5603/g.17034  ORF Transcript_5603/g.17034 Transcript_5603/m.17034 type:complete len:322 (+) Transcript_5603:564-1529(+)|eukprot:366285-Chlamydomonas_euryale.AAC.3
MLQQLVHTLRAPPLGSNHQRCPATGALCLDLRLRHVPQQLHHAVSVAELHREHQRRHAFGALSLNLPLCGVLQQPPDADSAAIRCGIHQSRHPIAASCHHQVLYKSPGGVCTRSVLQQVFHTLGVPVFRSIHQRRHAVRASCPQLLTSRVLEQLLHTARSPDLGSRHQRCAPVPVCGRHLLDLAPILQQLLHTCGTPVAGCPEECVRAVCVCSHDVCSCFMKQPHALHAATAGSKHQRSHTILIQQRLIALLQQLLQRVRVAMQGSAHQRWQVVLRHGTAALFWAGWAVVARDPVFVTCGTSVTKREAPGRRSLGTTRRRA